MKRLLILGLLLTAQLSMAAEPLGRLFTTAAERDALDRLRQSQRGQLLEQAPPSEAPETMPAPEPAPPQSLSIQGYIQRSDGGKGTVWVNHQPLQEGSDNGQVQVGKLNKNGIPVTIRENGRNVRLKAGQEFNPETGEITERNVQATEPAASPPPSLNTTSQGVIH